MKLMYVIILFLVFFNIFSFISVKLEIFPYEYTPDTKHFDIDGGSYQNFKNTTGFGIGEVVRVLFGDITVSNAVITIGMLVLALIAVKLAHSITPLVVLFFANMARVTYENIYGVMNQIEIDPLVSLAIGVGICFLIIITSVEYMTHGDV